MADREIAFSTFLKLLELTESQKTTTLRGFLRGGGFDYWRPLKNLAPDVASGELNLSGIQEKVGLAAKGHQRKYNIHALTRLAMWVSRKHLKVQPQPAKIIKKFCNSGIFVRLQPELAFTMDRRNYLMHIWATNNPTLTEETLSMGLHFFRLHFQEAGHNDAQFLIYDTVKDRIFAEFNMLDSSTVMLSRQRGILGSLWSNINGEGRPSPPGTDDRPSDEPDDRPRPP